MLINCNLPVQWLIFIVKVARILPIQTSSTHLVENCKNACRLLTGMQFPEEHEFFSVNNH